MTHTPEQLDAIIAGLSDNMRAALLHVKTASDGSQWFNFSVTGRTSRALFKRGLAAGSLTPLGQAVRARMMEVK